jgi:hypothetical protein
VDCDLGAATASVYLYHEPPLEQLYPASSSLFATWRASVGECYSDNWIVTVHGMTPFRLTFYMVIHKCALFMFIMLSQATSSLKSSAVSCE